jgi:hypothetical protein
MESSWSVLDACLTHFTSGGKVDTPCLFYTANRKGFTCLLCPGCAKVPVVPASQRRWPRNVHFDSSNSVLVLDYALEFHSSESRHEEQRNQLLLDLSRVKRVMQRYIRLSLPQWRHKIAWMHQISDSSWRNAVQAALYRYLMSPSMPVASDSNDDNPAAEQDKDLLEPPGSAVASLDAAVRSCEYWEHSAILACAVWKARCLMQMPERGSDNGTDSDLLAQLQWERSGWKTQKPLQRESEAISTILSAVRPFLDPLATSGSCDAHGSTSNNDVVSMMQFQSSDKALIEYMKLYSASPPFMRSRIYEYHEATECLLCERPSMDENARKFHFFDVQHKEREQLLQRDLVQMRKIMPRIVQLATPPLSQTLAVLQQVRYRPARDSVQASLYSFLSDTSEDVVQASLAQALDRLRLCELQEGLAMLTLAVWKSQCLWDMPPASSSCHDYMTALRWTRDGWKSCKAAQRESNAMNVIVLAVRPFLDPP